MALLNGKEPNEIAEEIMEQLEDRVIEITGAGFEALTNLARYENRDVIAAKGENWYNKNRDRLEKDTLGDFLVKKARTLDKYLQERRVQQSWELFRLLVSKGVKQDEAMSSAFPDGVPAPKK